jgi:hypothetical protein
MDVMEGVDYLPAIAEGSGSTLEMVFAIFTNVLDVDEDGRVINEHQATVRAAQYLRSYCDSSFVVSPPFEDWETELA